MKEYEEAYLQLDQNRSVWNEAERKLLKQAEPFLEQCLLNDSDKLNIGTG